MDILFTLDTHGILCYLENASVVGAIYALWECLRFQFKKEGQNEEFRFQYPWM